jgi:hypothetical protein
MQADLIRPEHSLSMRSKSSFLPERRLAAEAARPCNAQNM